MLSAIVKYHATERGRAVINDAMDVHGGKGICLGPNNYLGRAYQQVPIGITVEGANILTRSMIIFGQGAIRCHPYVLKEVEAASYADAAAGADLFDGLLWQHIAFVVGNAARSSYLGLGGARLKPVAGASELRRHYQDLSRLSAGFAFCADVSMMVLGGALKRKEKLSARLGDMLSYLYFASAVLKRYEDEGQQQTDLPLVRWAVEECCHGVQVAAYGVFENFPNRMLAAVLKRVMFPLGRAFKAPDDALGQSVVQLMMQPSATRDRLTADTFVDRSADDPVGRLDLALEGIVAAEAVESKIRALPALQAGVPLTLAQRVDAALANGAISAQEAEQWHRFEQLRQACIMVDDFAHDVGRRPQASDDVTTSAQAITTQESVEA